MLCLRIGLPPESTLSTHDGLMENHDYTDLRGLSWKDYQLVFAEEVELFEMARAGHDLYEDVGAYTTLCLGLDPGVASTVVALVASGCPTLSACSGERGHYEDHPLVVFWCPTWDHFKAVKAAANRVGVRLEGHGSLGLMVSADAGDLHLMRAFSMELAQGFLWRRRWLAHRH